MQDESAMRPRKMADYRTFTFRVQGEHYDVMRRAANALGIDLSALLNKIVTDAIPSIQSRLDQHEVDLSSLRKTLTAREGRLLELLKESLEQKEASRAG